MLQPARMSRMRPCSARLPVLPACKAPALPWPQALTHVQRMQQVWVAYGMTQFFVLVLLIARWAPLASLHQLHGCPQLNAECSAVAL